MSLFSEAETIHVDEFLTEINIENKISFLLVDTPSNITDLSKKKFKENSKISKTFKESQVLWGEFCINNTSKKRLNSAIRLSKYSSIELYNSKGDFLGESGTYFPINQRKNDINAISQINLSLEPEHESIYYIKLELKNQNNFECDKFPISLSNLIFLKKIKTSQHRFILFFTIGIILLIVYNFIHFLKRMKTHFFYLIILNLMVLSFIIVKSGQFENAFADNYFFHERLVLFFGNLSLLAFTLFSEKIFKFHQYDPIALKFTQYLIPFLILINIPIAFEIFIPLIFWIISILIFTVYSYIIYLGYNALERGEKYVVFVFVGNIFLFLGTTISALMVNDFIPKQLLGLTSLEVLTTVNFIQLFLSSYCLQALFKKPVRKDLVIKKSEN